jgi:hypothetical protein
VAADSGQLIVEAPPGTLTDADRALIRQYKPDLLRLVGRDPASTAATKATGSGLDDLAGHSATLGYFEACLACGTGSWIRYADVPLCRRCGETCGALTLAYWDTLNELYRLNSAGTDADPGACRGTIDRAAQLTDDLGADLAIRLRERWSRGTGRCPLCGGAAHSSSSTV